MKASLLTLSVLLSFNASATDPATCAILSRIKGELVVKTLNTKPLPTSYMLNGRRIDDAAHKPKLWFEETTEATCRPLSFLFQENSLILRELNMCGQNFMIGRIPHPSFTPTLVIAATEEPGKTVVACDYDIPIGAGNVCHQKHTTTLEKDAAGAIKSVRHLYESCNGRKTENTLELE